MDKNIALANIGSIYSALAEWGMKPFLCYGTALGAIREQTILDHDKDTDIGILEENFDFRIFTLFAKEGFAVRNIYGMRSFGFEIAFHRDGVKTDIMLFYKKDGKRFNCLWNNGGQNGLQDAIVHSYKAELIEKYEPANIEGRTFLVPSPSADYLEAVYGDWKTPVKEFDWRTDHKCKDNSII